MMILWLILIIILVLPYLIFRKPPKPDPHQRYDFLLILGCPSLADGSISKPQQMRLDAAKYYYEQGNASHIVISGAGVQNKFIEAEIMAKQLQAMLPQARIDLETHARNTYQNIKFTKEHFHGTHILIISSPSHLRRAYFFAKKFYPHAVLGCGTLHDPWYYAIWEYTRMWVALYWEIKLSLQAHKHKN